MDRYDKVERVMLDLRQADGGFATRDNKRVSELLDELKELRDGIAVETERVKAVRLVTEARREQNLIGSSDVSVTSESMTYGCNADYQSRNSWWADKIALSCGPEHPDYGAALQRSFSWSHEVEREIANGSKFGKYAERCWRDRKELREQRASIDAGRIMAEVRDRGRAALENKAEHRISGVGTGGGPTVSATSGASSFILPVFVGPYVPYKHYGRAFADQCAKPPLPDYGMAIYKPAVTGPAGDAAFTELGSVTEVDPTVGFLAGTLGIYAGQVTLSQAVMDRTAPDFRYDLMVQDQIERKEAPVLDAYVIAAAISNGATPIGYNSTFAVASTSGVTNSLYGHVSQAKATMRKAAGAVLNPTHVWFDPARWEVVAGWGDSQGRPVAVPDYAGPFNALAAGSSDGDAGIEGSTGYRFNGLRAFDDANLPTTGGTAALDQVLVCCMPEIEYYEGSAYNRILPQTLAGNLATIVQRYRYVTVIENYAAATQPIQGTAFTAPSWGS